MFHDDQGHVHVYENAWSNPEDHDLYFGNYTHWTNQRTADNKIVFNVAGSVNLIADAQAPIPWEVRAAFTGENSQQWKDAWLHIHLSLPHIANVYLPPANHWHSESAAPFVTLNGVDKGGDNHHGGWQVYNFGMDGNVEQLTDRIDHNKKYDGYSIWAHFGIRGGDFRIDRVGFTLTLVGHAQ